MTENIESYNTQLAVARTEIKNLRQQIASLKHEHLKEIKAIKNVLDGLRCASCGENASTVVSNHAPSQETITSNGECISFRPIGVIRTSFNTKRCVPRQASVVGNTQGFIEIYNSVFNNPEHAVFGLEEFSHMWIMFHFHQTESNSVPAKVSPPRLSGAKRGVFATRSPHRPCPIGLSLVKITKIEGNKIHFLGVDMVNGTPVLDVKPYIPHYDSPAFVDVNDRPPTEGIADGIGVSNVNLDDDISTNSRETAPVGSSENSPTPLADIRESILRGAGDPNIPPAQRQCEEANQGTERGSPDGQEHYTPQTAPIDQTVRIAPWISNPGQAYEVTFTSEALDKLTDLIGDRAESFKTNIQSLLCEDPRSHYVRTRYPDHEFSCVLEDLCISCIFDAGTSVCTIIAVRNAEEMQN